jgi:hypothetical protein
MKPASIEKIGPMSKKYFSGLTYGSSKISCRVNKHDSVIAVDTAAYTASDVIYGATTLSITTLGILTLCIIGLFETVSKND